MSVSHTALLRGRDHTQVDAIGAVAEGAAAAALSRGGAAKTYEYTDPNEDAAGYALGPCGVVLAVADAHRGCRASELAVSLLLERFAPVWLAPAAELAPARWADVASGALHAIHGEVLRETQEADRQGSRCAFAAALIRPDRDLLGFASLGDSHVFRVSADRSVELASEPAAPRFFLGSESLGRADIEVQAEADAVSLAGVEAVVLATDGLSELGIGVADPERTVHEAAEAAAGFSPGQRALELARGVAERAAAAHRAHAAGDNIGVAAAWIGAGSLRPR